MIHVLLKYKKSNKENIHTIKQLFYSANPESQAGQMYHVYSTITRPGSAIDSTDTTLPLSALSGRVAK